MRWVCQLPEVLGRTVCRRSVTRQIALQPRSRLDCPAVSFEGADRFRLENCRVLPGLPPTLRATVAYRLRYADGTVCLQQTDRAVFDLPLPAGGEKGAGLRRFESGGAAFPGGSCDGALIRVEALARAFAPVLCPQTGALILTIGAFFIIRREAPRTLLLPGEPARPKGGAADG